MAELKHESSTPIITTHYNVPQFQRRKLWVTAMSTTKRQQFRNQNTNVEAAFMRLLKEVKEQWLKPGTIYYEKDCRQNRDEGIMSMHCFITPHFCWLLQCNFEYFYEIEFAFHNCDYEAHIRAELRAYPFEKHAKEENFMPDYPTFYKAVLAIQDKKYVHLR